MKLKLINIILEKINKEYKEDIELLIRYDIKTESSTDPSLNLYFIPKNENALTLSTQYIIDGIGYDLFPMKWDRLLSVAAMDSPQSYLFEEAEILYVGNKEAEKKFNKLKAGLKEVLSGSYDDALLNKAYEYLNETYIYLYNMENVCQSIIDLRIEASKILKQVANILAFINRSYYKGGNGTSISIIKDSMSFTTLPMEYDITVSKIMESNDEEEIKYQSKSLINSTRSLLATIREDLAEKESFSLVFSGYYEELTKYLYQFHRAIKEKNTFKQYEIASYLHEEVGQFMTKVSKGIWYDDRSVYSDYSESFDKIFSVDFMSLIANRETEKLQESLNEFMRSFETLLLKEEVNIKTYSSIEAFKSDFL